MMIARNIMLFIICVNVAAPIVALMGIYTGGPAGTSSDAVGLNYVTMAFAIGLLAAGGTTILLFNVRIPAILGVFTVMYVASVVMMTTLIAQMIQPFDVALIVSGVFVALAGIAGVLGAMEISGGPHGPMA